MSWSVEDVGSHGIVVTLTKHSFIALETPYTSEKNGSALHGIVYETYSAAAPGSAALNVPAPCDSLSHRFVFHRRKVGSTHRENFTCGAFVDRATRVRTRIGTLEDNIMNTKNHIALLSGVPGVTGWM